MKTTGPEWVGAAFVYACVGIPLVGVLAAEAAVVVRLLRPLWAWAL